MGSVTTHCAPEPKRLTDAQQKELATLTGQLSDPSRSAKTKLEAAEMLLAKGYPQALEVLKDFLSGDNAAAGVAVAEAIAHSTGSQPAADFVDPLLAMLTGEDAEVRPAAAKALAVYKDNGVIDKLIAIVADRKREQSVRIVTISALQSTLDKKTVDVVVRLLDDRARGIRDAAADALANLTNIKAFRTNRRLAKEWWNRNRDKAPSEWLAALADSLARGKAELEADNTRLRKRLTQALRDQYDAVPESQQEALLLGFLADPLGDVRLAGTVLAEAKITGGEKVSEKLQVKIRALVKDPDFRVRQASVLLVAHQGDEVALGALLAGLKSEENIGVRQAILTALGHLKSPEAVEAVLAEISNTYDSVAAAAALALGRIASAKPLSGDVLTNAGKALVRRYNHKSRQDQDAAAAMREAVLTAMGVIGHKSFLPVLRRSLKDTNATVRLAGVNSLARIGQSKDAGAIAALVGDSDRGVRRASIAALGELGGRAHLPTILKRTDPETEADEAVRKQAWEVVMGLLVGADAETLAAEANRLVDRPDAINQRIKILEMLVAVRKTARSDKLPQALRTLGQALLAGSRPAEAAGHFRTAYDALVAARDDGASEAWLELVNALLSADDTGAIKAMVAQSDAAAFEVARKALRARLTALVEDQRYDPAILLADKAVESLSQRLTVEERKEFKDMLVEARAERSQFDRKRVSQLVGQLTAADEAARTKALGEFQVMASRAVVPLLEVLKSGVQDDTGDPRSQQAIIAVLKQIAPKLTGYDPEAPRDRRVKVIEDWLKELKKLQS